MLKDVLTDDLVTIQTGKTEERNETSELKVLPSSQQSQT